MLDHAADLSQLAATARTRFRQIFGHQATWVVAAPGRVNLIGEHTDYNDGFVLPMAIDRHVVIAAARPEETTAGEFDFFSDLIDDRQSFTVTGAGPQELPAWCVYPYGVLDLLHQRGIKIAPVEAVVLSTVPQGGGLSSSAAFEVATATLAEAVSGQRLDPADKAKLCQQAENEYAGVPCGIMDQFASAACRAGEAMRIDCRSLATTPAPLTDEALGVLIINSNVKHNLGESEYPLRRAQCEAAAAKLGVAALRDANAQQLEAAKSQLNELEYRRARHVIGANERVESFITAATAGDWPAAGQLMYASHTSLRDDYQVSCPQVDRLVELATEVGLAGGVYGSRITGGGFGGCTVSLIKAAAVGKIVAAILPAYQASTGIEATAFLSRPARGAHIITP